MNFPSASSFRSSGYTPIKTNDSYSGGLVRQHGRFSFSRVFEAGHAVTAYQPETVYRIFERSMFGRDVATGEIEARDHYGTEGPLSSWEVKNKAPTERREDMCYTYIPTDTCTDE